MKKYQKVYEFDNNTFFQKLRKKVFPHSPLGRFKTVYGNLSNRRIFVGKIDKEGFTIWTFPNDGSVLLYPPNFFKQIFLFLSPTQIRGKVKEEEGKTVIWYSLQKRDVVYFVLGGQLMILSLCCLVGMIDLLLDDGGLITLLTIGGCVGIAIILLTGMLCIPQPEEEAFHNLLEGLKEE